MDIRNTYELQARYDSRQSFYGKALVEEGEGKKTLYSYLTEVAIVEEGGKAILREEAICSQTTIRHVREFVRQETGRVLSKKDMRGLIA